MRRYSSGLATSSINHSHRVRKIRRQGEQGVVGIDIAVAHIRNRMRIGTPKLLTRKRSGHTPQPTDPLSAPPERPESRYGFLNLRRRQGYAPEFFAKSRRLPKMGHDFLRKQAHGAFNPVLGQSPEIHPAQQLAHSGRFHFTHPVHNPLGASQTARSLPQAPPR